MMTLEEAMRHAGGPTVDNRIEARCREALPKYFWTMGSGKKKKAYCSFCHETWEMKDQTDMIAWRDIYVEEWDMHPERQYRLEGPIYSTMNQYRWSRNPGDWLDNSGKQGHFGICPLCGALGKYKSLNRSRAIFDRAFLIQYRMSFEQPGVYVMLGWSAERNWETWDDYNEDEPDILVLLRELVVFRPGRKGERFVRDPLWVLDDEDFKPAGEGRVRVTWHQKAMPWEHRTRCRSGYNPWRAQWKDYWYVDMESIDMLDGTMLGGILSETMASREHKNADYIELSQHVTRWRCYEYLWKLGYQKLAITSAKNGNEDMLLNLRGKTAQAVMRVDGNDWGWIKGHRVECDRAFLISLQQVRKQGWRLGCDLIAAAARRYGPLALKKLAEKVEPRRAGKTVRYLLKTKGESAASDYADYMDQLKALDMDRSDERNLYPKDLQKIHTELSRRIKHLKSKEKDALITARVEKELGEYFFSALGLTMRPMLSSEEIITEGTKMEHCVGSYVDNYAKGMTILCALREDERPGTPWRTLEFSADKGVLIQCRGKHNQSPLQEQPRIDEFFRLFEQYRKEYWEQHRTKKAKGRKCA